MKRNTTQSPKDLKTETPEAVLNQHEGLVKRIANKYRAVGSRVGLEFEDLMQEGRIGLLSAHDGFDPMRGFEFSTYATPVIHRTIHKAIREQEPLRLPQQARTLFYRIREFCETFFAKHGDDPTDGQILNGLSVAHKDLTLFVRLRKLRQSGYDATPPASLDAIVGETGEMTFGDFVTYSQSSEMPFGVVNGTPPLGDAA